MKVRCCDDIPVPKLPGSIDAALAQLAQALGHPARVAIVRLLYRRDSCVCGEIVDQLPLAQSTVSQHLKILKEAGWVCGAIDGPRVCYCINPAAAAKFEKLIGTLLGSKHDTARIKRPARNKLRKTVPAAAARRK